MTPSHTQVTGGPKFGPLLPGQTFSFSSSMSIIQDIITGDAQNPIIQDIITGNAPNSKPDAMNRKPFDIDYSGHNNR